MLVLSVNENLVNLIKIMVRLNRIVLYFISECFVYTSAISELKHISPYSKNNNLLDTINFYFLNVCTIQPHGENLLSLLGF